MGINLKDYYSQKQVMTLLEFEWRMQVVRWRERHSIKFILICDKPFYLRSSVDGYFQRYIDEGVLSVFIFEERRYKFERPNLDLDEWLPRCQALELFGHNAEYMYAISGVRTAMPMIRTRRAYGQNWFYRPDLERMKKMVEDDQLRLL